jgi:hypothetical protein
MADIYDRIFNDNPDNETPTLNVHGLTATLNLVVRGIFTDTQAKTFWNMDTAASNDFDALVTLINAASTKSDKLEVLNNLEAAGIATEIEAITTKAAYKSAAGIT